MVRAFGSHGKLLCQKCFRKGLSVLQSCPEQLMPRHLEPRTITKSGRRLCGSSYLRQRNTEAESRRLATAAETFDKSRKSIVEVNGPVRCPRLPRCDNSLHQLFSGSNSRLLITRNKPLIKVHYQPFLFSSLLFNRCRLKKFSIMPILFGSGRNQNFCCAPETQGISD